MAKKDLLAETGDLTTEVKKEEKKYEGPRVPVRLPKLQNIAGSNATIDQYEHVTISNETGMEQYKVQRGTTVEVPVPVFIALYEKYGKDIAV